MKKILSILLIIIFLVSLVACSPSQSNQPPQKSGQDDSSTNHFEPNEAYWIVNHKLAYFKSLEEYENYLSSNSIPKDFISYEDISDFGEFGSFSLDDNFHYSYLLKNQNAEIYLCIYPEAPSLKTYNILSPTANIDMRICPGTSEGVELFTHNGLLYRYMDGLLKDIYWTSGNIRFSLSVFYYHSNQGGFSSYTGDNVAINALLNKDTAGSVKLAFDNMMAQKDAAEK